MQAVSFSYNGTQYVRSISGGGKALHRAGNKIISAAAFAEAQTQAEGNTQEAIIAAVVAAPVQAAPVQAVAQPMALLAGVVQATAPAPSPANPFAGLVAAATAEAAKPAKRTATPRPEAVVQNGQRRPGPGKCLDVWLHLDAKLATGTTPKVADAKAYAEATGTNPSNAQIEYYAWRKFNGITGRL